MTHFEVKDYCVSFPGELLTDINDSGIISKECTEIVPRGKKTFIVFNGPLTGSEKTALTTFLSTWTPPGVNTTTLPGIGDEISEPMTFSLDALRNKHLSTETTTVVYSENRLNNMDWVNIGMASNSAIGLIMPFAGTIIRVTGLCRSVNNQIMNMHLYINNDSIGNVLIFSGSGEQIVSNLTANIDFSAGDKLRLRGVGTGRIEDIAITLWIKWRRA